MPNIPDVVMTSASAASKREEKLAQTEADFKSEEKLVGMAENNTKMVGEVGDFLDSLIKKVDKK